MRENPDDGGLEALFAEARRDRPPAALVARVLADAEAARPGRRREGFGRGDPAGDRRLAVGGGAGGGVGGGAPDRVRGAGDGAVRADSAAVTETADSSL